MHGNSFLEIINSLIFKIAKLFEKYQVIAFEKYHNLKQINCIVLQFTEYYFMVCETNIYLRIRILLLSWLNFLVRFKNSLTIYEKHNERLCEGILIEHIFFNKTLHELIIYEVFFPN